MPDAANAEIIWNKSENVTYIALPSLLQKRGVRKLFAPSQNIEKMRRLSVYGVPVNKDTILLNKNQYFIRKEALSHRKITIHLVWLQNYISPERNQINPALVLFAGSLLRDSACFERFGIAQWWQTNRLDEPKHYSDESVSYDGFKDSSQSHSV